MELQHGLLRVGKGLIILFIFMIITIFTQVGGLYYLAGLWLQNKLGKWKGWAVTLVFYLVSVFTIIPLLASLNNRYALPISGSVAPLNIGTCLLNRHYVDATTLQGVNDAGERLSNKYPGASISYLDANFPFINGFPLLPHLSHSDGKKLDIAFQYDKKERISKKTPSFIGYGYFEAPEGKEVDYNQICTEKGHKLYGILGKIIPIQKNHSFQLNRERTTFLINTLHKMPQTEKIFLEPHLKKGWHLENRSKIRFHGCHAVRHDDHLHWQTR